MNARAKHIFAFTVSFLLSTVLISCSANPILSVSHFQDATTLEPGESKYFISFEEALYFQAYVNDHTTNDFTRKPYILTPNYHLGLAPRFELGVQVLPITFTSYGGNIYLKFSDSLSSLSSFGVVLLAGMSEANGDDNQPYVFLNERRVTTAKVYNFSIMFPYTLAGKLITLTLAPSIGNYQTYFEEIQDPNHHITSNYLAPSLSTDVSFMLPLNGFITLEFSTIKIENALFGFYGVGLGKKGFTF